MTRYVWILPIGLEFDRALATLGEAGREFYLLHSQTNDKVSEEATEFALRVQRYLENGPFVVLGRYGVDVLDLKACVHTLMRITRDEVQRDKDTVFRVNVGTSSKIMTLACLYVAARDPARFELFYPRTRDYLIVDIVGTAREIADARAKRKPVEKLIDRLVDHVRKYGESGWTSKPLHSGYGMVPVPVIPIQEMSETQVGILKALYHAKDAVSSGAALAGLVPAFMGKRKGEVPRSSISFALGDLVRWRFVTLTPEGNRKSIHLTPAGHLYVEAFLVDVSGSRLLPASKGRKRKGEDAP